MPPGSGDTARGLSGATSRIVRRHRARSAPGSGRRRRFGGFALIDQDYMETARPMRTELDALLDVASARRAGDEVDSARQSPTGPQQVPAILVGSKDLTGADHDDVRVGKEIQRRRRAF